MSNPGTTRTTAPPPTNDSTDLARFGYQQELQRSLGSFSSFAAGFSYISIMTGVFQLFGFGFASGGPAFVWTWPLVFIGQGPSPSASPRWQASSHWPAGCTSGRNRSRDRSPRGWPAGS